jgi:alpha-tubulin suppressor-like RCC1 family protein
MRITDIRLLDGWTRRVVIFVLSVTTLATLGVATPTADAAPVPPTPAKVASGRDFSCALMSDATVRCWGSNSAGALGNGAGGPGAVSGTPVTVVGLTGVQSLSAGSNHACAITAGGKLYCWGANDAGQVGYGTLTERRKPVNVTPAGVTFRLVTTGDRHTCAATTDHRLYCWGAVRSWHYESIAVVDATYWLRPRMLYVPPGPIVTISIVRDGYHIPDTCVQVGAGGTWARQFCKGDNFAGQWGVPESATNTLATVSGWKDLGLAPNPREATTGAGHRCVLDATAGLRCWGNNFHGQLGGYDTFNGVQAFKTVGAGYTHTCGYWHDTARHEYRCWGNNGTGQLGSGSTEPLAGPSPVKGLYPPYHSSEASVSGGDSHTCAIGRDRSIQNQLTKGVFCWGSNQSGQLGNGSTAKLSRTAVRVAGI